MNVLQKRLIEVENLIATTFSTSYYFKLLLEERQSIKRRVRLLEQKEAKLTENRKENFKEQF